MEQEIKQILEGKAVEPGGTFKAFCIFREVTKRQDKNGKTYYDAIACDSTGNLDAKIWSDALWLDKSGFAKTEDEHMTEDDIAEIVGKTIGINVRVTEYKGAPQYSITKVTLLNQDQYPPSAYVAHSPIPQKILEARFERLVSQTDGKINDFLKFVFTDKLKKDFFYWPAATGYHHAYAAGLLEHTVSVTDLALNMAKTLEESGYVINKNIVIAGALFHDIGKLRAYRMTSVPEVTVGGVVLDHIALGYEMIARLADEFGLEEKTKLHLLHIILSHHGQRDFGSPVVPGTPEAMVISSSDELDFRMFCCFDALKTTSTSFPISAWNNATQRRFWRTE
ncbi:MAG: HD domain-containing protein [Synergistaceae bacterium]|nr:HD domain-containing protein [Synergistaceae bacterium]